MRTFAERTDMKKGPATRAAILREAFRLSYTRGYQLTSIDDILRNLGITKGAFYHHFSNKEVMGKALIDELLAPQMQQMYDVLLATDADPLKAIHRMMRRLLFEEPELLSAYGCPMGNLVQELGAADSQMRDALSEIMAVWQSSLERLLRKASTEGFVKKGLRAASIAGYLISGYWGVRTLGKIGDADAAYKAYLQELERYLDGLRVVS
jgi:TetR/AcrR family transcriptional repressor of nem operon